MKLDELKYNIFKLENAKNVHEKIYYATEIKLLAENMIQDFNSNIKRQRNLDKSFLFVDKEEVEKNRKFYQERAKGDK